MKRTTMLAIAIAIILATLLIAGCTPIPTGKVIKEEKVKIGAILPLTGLESAQGELAQRGMILAQKES